MLWRITMRRFEIWLADLNPPHGREPGKVRPVVIVQSNLLNSEHPTTIVCPITSNVAEDTDFLRINLADSANGLDRPSAVMCDHIRAIDRRRLIKRIGMLNIEARRTLQRNILVVLDLEAI